LSIFWAFFFRIHIIEMNFPNFFKNIL
jgi:hypothetical protein